MADQNATSAVKKYSQEVSKAIGMIVRKAHDDVISDLEPKFLTIPVATKEAGNLTLVYQRRLLAYAKSQLEKNAK